MIVGNLNSFLIADRMDGKRSLDVRHGAAFGARPESRGRSASAGAAGASYSVDEVFRNLRKIVIYDVRDSIDVDAAGSYIGCDQYALVALLESAESLIALVLAAVSVNGGRLDTRPASLRASRSAPCFVRVNTRKEPSCRRSIA
jgi:hypothetical protein